MRGFEVGADDYLTKPFSSMEFLARVRAVLKRSRQEMAGQTEAEISCGPLRIELARRRVTTEGQEIRLTCAEYNFLHELVAHKNKIVLYEQLLTAMWGFEYRDDLDYLRAYIRYLRHKFEADPANPKLIVTSPGVGCYMLECPEEQP